MRKRISTTVVALGAATALAACGSDTDGGSSPTPSTPASTAEQTTSTVTSAAAPTTSAVTSAAAPTTSAAPAAAGKPMTVNKTIKDKVLGHSITVLKYVDNAYQPTAAELTKYPSLEDEKVVLVQVKATSGSKYYGGVMNDDFRLVKAGEGGYDAFPTSDLDASVAKAGYPAFRDLTSGKSGSGWIVFTPPKTYSKLVFGYKRLKTSLPGGKTLPAQLFPVALN